MSEIEQVKEETSLPPGYRFHPTDEELVVYYLMNKISDANFTTRAITDVDLNKCEPWDLPGKAKMGKKEWYFFNQRDRKYPTGVRTNRATNTGYWKTTGKDKEIYNSTTSEHIGMKKTLVFYKGRAPRGEKMNWVMHEYRMFSRSTFRINKQDDAWVVCRVFQKSACGKKHPAISNHHQHASTRAMNYTYNLQMTQTNVAMPMLDQPWQHFPTGRNYTVTMGNNMNNNNIVLYGDIVENISTSRTTSNLGKGSNIMVLDNMMNCNPTTTTTMMVPGPHDGCFTMSNLKLNASGSSGSSVASGQAIANIFRQSHQHDQETIAALYGGGMVDGLHAPSSGGTNQFMEDFMYYTPPY